MTTMETWSPWYSEVKITLDCHLLFFHLVRKLDHVGLQLLAGVVVEGALLVHELHRPDLVALHIEVAEGGLLRLELTRPIPLKELVAFFICEFTDKVL